ncbi:phage tail assembly chaperone [Sphingomonas panacis]|uniref:phage tail assembly chaperone n=1 Tax=Sphingomonas panacis TaxID=1560345 RepID=UPI003B845FAA
MSPIGGTEGDGDDDDRDPRRRLAGIATSALGWTPATFWSSTPHEFWAAFEVWKSMNSPPEE